MIKVILLFILFTGAAFGDSGKMVITFSATGDGGGIIYEIDTSVVPGLPKWNIASDEPPLSLKSALSLARRELYARPHDPVMKLASIRLSSASMVGETDVWFYSITHVNDAKYRKDGFVEKTIHILMNGNVLIPRKITREEYEQWFK